jgi:hypothetical protein
LVSALRARLGSPDPAVNGTLSEHERKPDVARKPSTLSDEETRVVAITAARGRPSAFVIDSGAGVERVESSSILVLETLLPALLTGAKPVKVDLGPGTLVINRVTPFALGKGREVFFAGEFTVTRVATQRKPDGTDEHLEVFLMKTGSPEKAYNVYDPFLQVILIAAFGLGTNGPTAPHVDVKFEGEDIASVSLGQGALTRPG